MIYQTHGENGFFGTCIVIPDIDQLLEILEGNNSGPRIQDLLQVRNTND